MLVINMKKKLFLITIVVLGFTFVMLPQLVFAWSSPNNRTAFAVGTDYRPNFLSGDINTTEEAKYAHNVYSSMGWNSVLITETTTTNMVGKHSNGYAYLESSIVFLSGHGSAAGMSWDYKGKGGKHNVIIRHASSINFTVEDGAITIGLGGYKMSQNDLIVYAGCQTANGTTNLTNVAVSRGAQTAIGWSTDVHAISHVTWLKRFNDKLKEKKSIQVAAEYANSFNYSNNSVKNYVIFGDKNFILGENYEIASSASLNNIIEDINRNEYIINKEITTESGEVSENDIKRNIEKTIQETIYSDFNASDYKVEINGSEIITYDYVLYVKGARTDLGYTIKVKGNKILNIFDNTNGKNIETIKKNADKDTIQKVISTKMVTSSLTKAKKYAQQEYDNFDTEVVDNIIYLDTNDNQLYEATFVKVTDKNGNHSIISKFEIIK